MNICLMEESENFELSFSDERGKHILKVLHKKEGDYFSCGIVNGKAGKAKITKIDEESKKIYFDFSPESEGKPLFPLKMIIGFPRPIQLKRLLRDMAGLGVCEVHLTQTELGEKSYLQSDLATTDAGYKMLYDGSVQAASTHVPKLFIHKSLKECIEAVRDENTVLMTLDNISPKMSLGKFMMSCSKNKTFVAAIGSERGWTDNERKQMIESGFELLSMGNRVLRTETASTVSASIILNALELI